MNHIDWQKLIFKLLLLVSFFYFGFMWSLIIVLYNKAIRKYPQSLKLNFLRLMLSCFYKSHTPTVHSFIYGRYKYIYFCDVGIVFNINPLEMVPCWYVYIKLVINLDMKTSHFNWSFVNGFKTQSNKTIKYQAQNLFFQNWAIMMYIGFSAALYAGPGLGERVYVCWWISCYGMETRK